MNLSTPTIRTSSHTVAVAAVLFGIGALSVGPAHAVPTHVLTNPGFTVSGQAGANPSIAVSDPASAGNDAKTSKVFPPANPIMNGTIAPGNPKNDQKNGAKGANPTSFVGLAVSGPLTLAPDNDQPQMQVSSNVVEPHVVPIPAALPMLAAAVAGLGFAGWRRKRAAA
jgi:hypothetical protein